jgi:hypothetical protein
VLALVSRRSLKMSWPPMIASYSFFASVSSASSPFDCLTDVVLSWNLQVPLGEHQQGRNQTDLKSTKMCRLISSRKPSSRFRISSIFYFFHEDSNSDLTLFHLGFFPVDFNFSKTISNSSATSSQRWDIKLSASLLVDHDDSFNLTFQT